MPLVKLSVIVASYNHAKYLEGCVQSILNQTYQDFELIIVNDGSTDNTDEVVSRFSGNEKVRYIKQNNAGQAIATNNGIVAAKGDLIAFLDADDLWDHTKLEKQIGLFTRNSTGVVYSRLKLIDADGLPVAMPSLNQYYVPRSGRITEHLLFENFIPYSSTIVRRECFDKFGMFNPEYKNGLDWDLWLRISTEYEFDFVNEPLLLYRMGHPGQLISNVERSVNCSDLIFSRFIEHYPTIVSQRVINRALAYSYCKRGNMLRKIDRSKSTGYFLSSLGKNPVEIDAYKGLIKNMLIGLRNKL